MIPKSVVGLACTAWKPPLSQSRENRWNRGMGELGPYLTLALYAVVALGECKDAGGAIDAADVANLRSIADAMPRDRFDLYIVFCKTGAVYASPNWTVSTILMPIGHSQADGRGGSERDGKTHRPSLDSGPLFCENGD